MSDRKPLTLEGLRIVFGRKRLPIRIPTISRLINMSYIYAPYLPIDWGTLDLSFLRYFPVKGVKE